MLIRLNKHIADLGIASRRKADELIEQGMIEVNGKIVTELGTKVDPEIDKIKIANEVQKSRQELIYLMLNKPSGYVTSNQKTKSEPNIVLDLVLDNSRLFPVGRLDKDTTGLLILTNDGVLAYRLTHPKFDCEKEYEVTLSEPLTKERIKKIEAGVKLEYKKTKPTKVRVLSAKKARVTLTEGKNRQVRKIFGKVGCEVVSLKRIRVKNLKLASLPLGKWRKLKKEELEDLLG